MAEFTFEQALSLLRKFTQERSWGNYHKPKDMVLKLMEEVGEVAEHFEWQSNQEVLEGLENSNKKAAVGEELVDVLVVTLIMMDLMELDIESVFKKKLKKNADKYPVDEDPKQIKDKIQKGL